MARMIEVTMTFRAVLTERAHTVNYDDHSLADAIRFHVGLSELDSIEADISAFQILGAKEVPRVGQ